ncbi:alpha-galactosidase [Pedobacter sp. SL55]|uniref:alpha-galactosidase n=1 Tax=Pedobacter sp. SL55 TaxID=2995161 RepID=UPI00227175EB|nr:alpha-galactosidase [Pedobacter sp. SL55]WAC39796.1 alpha-galactosidase [Pedobacter sp. SL55]
MKCKFSISFVLNFFLLTALLPKYVFAQGEIISIETKNHALVLNVTGKKDLNTIYLGKKLANKEEYAAISSAYKQTEDYTEILNSAYTPSGSRNLVEPAITATHADGNNSLDLRYIKHEIKTLKPGVSLTKIYLKDPVYPFEVSLFYKTYFNEDVVEQWTEISHKEKGLVTLHKYASANLHIKRNDFWLRQFYGDWAKEMQAEESKITHGIKTLDSKLGTRANLFQPPVFMVSFNKPATETEGEVLFGSLQWSGNFRTDLELDHQDNLRIISGINNFASPYALKANEVFTTPVFMYTFSAEGKGLASRNLHNWAREYKLLDGNGERLTLLNNWEATYFDFDEKILKDLLKSTKKLGVDLFLLDDGWFANKYPRNGDVAGLGDWQENKKKLPNGISSLVTEATANGVKFGIWIEPEMVNPKSELYEKNPDWVIKQPQREEHYFRNQLVLDLSNPKVQDFVFGVVDGLFTKNPELAYIKWDCNAVIYNAHSAYLKNQSHLYIEYVRGLYKVLEKIRTKYPKVPIMLCSGGGGRVDYAALQYFTEFWPSDNTDPLERIFIQWENSYFYPAISSANHVTDWGKQPIKFRTDVAMMGKLGFDIVIDHLKENDLKFAQQSVKNYDAVKHIIWKGDQYRLSHPKKDDVAAMLFVSKDKASALLCNYLVNNRYGAGSKFPVKLEGLDPNKKYKLTETNLYPETKSATDESKVYSGDFLMKVGFNPQVNKDRASVILKIEAQ